MYLGSAVRAGASTCFAGRLGTEYGPRFMGMTSATFAERLLWTLVLLLAPAVRAAALESSVQLARHSTTITASTDGEAFAVYETSRDAPKPHFTELRGTGNVRPTSVHRAITSAITDCFRSARSGKATTPRGRFRRNRSSFRPARRSGCGTDSTRTRATRAGATSQRSIRRIFARRPRHRRKTMHGERSSVKPHHDWKGGGHRAVRAVEASCRESCPGRDSHYAVNCGQQ